jgi:hypothetical protein
LSGTGVSTQTPAALSAAPASLSFGNVTVGQASSMQTLTVTNTGGSPAGGLVITSSNVGEFVMSSNTCGSSLGAGAQCSFKIAYTPAGAGADNAGLTVAFTGGSSVQITMSGTGVAAAPPANPAALSVSPTALSFGSVTVGQSSGAQSLVVTNVGGSTGNGMGIANGNPSEFVLSNNTCGSSLAAGASCSFKVTYTPSGVGADSANLAASLTGGATVQVAMTATGIAPASPKVSASPSSLAFGSITVGQTSGSQTITVSNTGTGAATDMVYPAAPAKFNKSGTCSGATLGAGASCTVVFTYSPTSSIADNATYTITGGGSTLPVSMSGTGTPLPAASLSVSPGSLLFGTVTLGAASSPQTVTVANGGGAAASGLTMTNSNASEFVVSANTCGSSLAADTSCSLNVTYTPTGSGADNGKLTFTVAGGAAIQVAMKGFGAPVATPNLSAVPTMLSFGSITVGTVSAPQTIVLSNSGGAEATGISFANLNAARFRQVANTCGAKLGPGARCTLAIVYEPSAASADNGAITVSSAGAGIIPISLSGAGTAAASASLSASPPLAAFGNVELGETSAAIAITVTNTGSGAATGLSLANSNGAEFLVSGNTCGATLAPGAACTLSVAYSPSAAGLDNAALTFDYGGGGSLSVPLSGMNTVVAPPPGIGQLSMPATVNMPDQLLGNASAPQEVMISNVGTDPVKVASIRSSNAGEFSVSGNTCSSVAAGESCTFKVTFAPFGIGARNAAITVTSDAAESPQAIQASGSGLSGGAPPPPPPPYATAAIEYYHAAFDHYFITANAAEIKKLDTGLFNGWIRTGKQFNVYPVASAGLKTACRFFSTSFGIKSSHFYTPDAPECSTVMSNPSWQFEGDVFHTMPPAQDGSCPAGMSPVYRMYNNGQGGAPNHRYTTDTAVRTIMLAQGWIAEGYGAIGVIMCAPQ